MTKIRISGVSDLATARATAALNIDYIGLNLTHGTKNAISPIKVGDYTQWLSGVKIVAQVHHLNQEKAQRFIELLKLPLVEIKSAELISENPKIWSVGFSDKSPFSVVEVSDLNESELTNRKAFIKLPSQEINSAEALKLQGYNCFDLDVNEYLVDDNLDFEKIQSVVNQLKG